MTNKIGEKIKTLRKKANITQEKLAEYLNITFQAVSRWESGTCYPDIEMLPSIANYFNITTDELLGVDILNKQERIDEIHKQIQLNFSKGLVEENVEICRNAVNEFPNDFRLLSDLAFYLGIKEDTWKEAISINERILADCTDDQIRYGVMQKLAYGYNNIGENEKAIKIAKKLPYTPLTCNMLLRHIYKGEERITQLKENIQQFCDYITSDITTCAYTKYNDDKDTDGVQKRIELYKKAIDIYKIIYEKEDYGFYNTRMKDLYLYMAINYMLLNDYENVFDCITKAADYAVTFDILPEPFTHTSIILNGKDFSKNIGYSKDYNYNDSYELLNNWLSHERYNPIRETEQFKAVIAKLEKYASKEA